MKQRNKEMTLFIVFFIGFFIGGMVDSYKVREVNKPSLPPIQPKRKIKNS